jgi:glycosyltransferase involved in cell wall biosynthesis
LKIILSTEAIHPPLAGIGRYSWELATRLAKHPAVEQVRYMSDGGWCELPDPEVPVKVAPVVAVAAVNHAQANVADVVPTPVPVPIPEPVLNFKGRMRKRLEWLPRKIVDQTRHQIILCKQKWPSLRSRLGQIRLLAKIYGKLMPLRASNQLDEVEIGLFHGPNYFVPKTHLPTVVTIHDLSIYRYPQWHPQARIDRMRVAIPESIKRAKLIIAISEATRQEVIATFNLPSERVQTVLLGVDAIYQPRSAEIVQPVLDQFGLRYGEFSFFVSTIEPRKNLRNLIAAYGQMPLELRMRYPLVLVGGRGWQSEDIHADIQKASNEGWLKYLGFVEQSCLPMLYAGCRLFTYPSWYEGFGLPIAEAMASGVPVLTANNSSMPEVAAGAALLVDPANVDDIAQQWPAVYNVRLN